MSDVEKKITVKMIPKLVGIASNGGKIHDFLIAQNVVLFF